MCPEVNTDIRLIRPQFEVDVRMILAGAAERDLLVNQGGIPTVLFGPGSIAAAHRADECVGVDEVIDCTKSLALLICGWCC